MTISPFKIKVHILYESLQLKENMEYKTRENLFLKTYS